jgi:hypothetical protein
MQVREVPVPLLEIESVPDEELVWHREADVADGEVLDEPAVGPIEQRHRRQRRWVAERKRPAEVVEAEARVDDVLDDQDVAARDARVEILQEPDPCVTAGVGVRAVGGELDEVEAVRDVDRARQVGDEDHARLERRDQERLASVVVAGELAAELTDALRELLAGEVDLADLVTDGA